MSHSTLEVPPPPTAQATPPAKKTRWGVVIGFGCFGLLVLGAALIVGIFAIVMGTIKSADAYKQAMAKAATHPDVIAKLGTPIEPGWIILGKISVSGPAGEANLSIPISGPTGRGTLYVVGEKQAGAWNYSVLQIEVEGEAERIDLLADAQGPTEEPVGEPQSVEPPPDQ
jgi:hypothetical protein